MSSAQFRSALEAGDYMGMWAIMAGAFPGSPQPKTPEQAEIAMHRIRTEAESLPILARCYSHLWLLDKGVPSGLPDRLLPAADRIYPRVVDAVGVAVRMPAIFRGVAAEVERSMSDAVEELHADGVDLANRPVVHGLMFERRERTLKSLIGSTAIPKG